MPALSQTPNAIYDREYRRKNHEAVLEREALYRETHREQMRAKARRFYIMHREEILAERKANPDLKARKTAWREAHPEPGKMDALRRRVRRTLARSVCETDAERNVRALGMLAMLPSAGE